MNRKLYLLNAVMALAVSGILAGCNDDPVEPEKPQVEPEFVIEESNFDSISHEGATLAINYYVSDPVEDARIVFDTEDIDWVGNASAAANGIITVEVYPNESLEPRTGEITVMYVYVSGDEEKVQKESIVLTQLGAPEPEPVIPFVITLTDGSLTYDSVGAAVTPADAEMTYVVMTIEKEIYDIQIASESALWTQILNQYVSRAAAEGMSLEELFEEYDILKKGEAEVLITGLEAETDYYLFAVGMSPAGVQLSDFVFETFTTLEVPVAPAEFVFEISMDGTSGSINIIPADDQLYYYCDVIAVNVFDETIMYWDDYAQSIIDQNVDLYIGLGLYETIEDMVKDICYQGEHEMPVYLLSPNTDYYVYAFGMGFDGLLSTEVCTDVFTTGDETM